MTSIPIIFVWIGEKLPPYVYSVLRYCKYTNPCKEIILISNARNSQTLASFAKLIILEVSEINYLASLMPEMQYRGDFWINTSLRFLVLNNFIHNSEIQCFYHAELDNIIFNLDTLDHSLPTLGKGIFVPRDSDDRAIASLIFCNRPESISELVNLFFSNDPPLNDMDSLVKYSQQYENYFYALPTESYLANSEKWSLIQPNKVGRGIFDAASLGQYLLGIDPIHCRFKPCRNGYVNENCSIDFASIEFIVDKSLMFLRFRKTNEQFRIYNIHLHSKNFSAFSKLMSDNSHILRQLNSGKTSILSSHSMVLIGPILSIISKIITPLKRWVIMTLRNH